MSLLNACPKPTPRVKKVPKRIRPKKLTVSRKEGQEGRRDPEYRRWIMQQPCAVIAHARIHSPCQYFGDRAPIEPAHVKPKGSGGWDRKNILPLCNRHHDEQEGQTFTFEQVYFFRKPLAELAVVYDAEYERSRAKR